MKRAEPSFAAAEVRADSLLLSALVQEHTHHRDSYPSLLRKVRSRYALPGSCSRIACLLWTDEPDRLLSEIPRLDELSAGMLRHGAAFAFVMDQHLLLLLNYGEGNGLLLLDELRGWLPEASRLLEEPLAAFVGCESFGFSGLPSSFRAAMSAWEQSLRQPPTEPVVVNDLHLAREDNLTFLPELHLSVSYLLAHEFLAAYRVMASVFDRFALTQKPYDTAVNERTSFLRSSLYQAVEEAISDDPEAVAAYLALRREQDSVDKNNLDMQRISAIYEEICTIADRAYRRRMEQKHEAARQIREYIDTHFTDPGLDIPRLSDELGISVSHLHRQFKAAYEQTILSYITNRRIQEAQRLLKQTTRPVHEIAGMVGYGSQVSFFRAFQKACFLTPEAYRRSARSVTQDA